MGNTSTKTAEEIRKEISRVLDELASYSLIQSISNPKRYVFPCYSALPASVSTTRIAIYRKDTRVNVTVCMTIL